MKVIVAFVQYYLFVTTTILLSVRSETARTHLFRVKLKSVKLAESLPLHARLGTILPDFISAAVVVSNNNNESEAALVGPPIHVVEGEILSVKLQNEISDGVTLHFHGFGYSNAFEYAGAVGVSQCPLAGGESFLYNFTVNEHRGTYWYHTEAGNLNEYNAVRGPLIVHPRGNEVLVDRLNSAHNQIAYENERILFFQDGFVASPAERYLQHIGNLLPPATKSDEGFVVATSQWNFGTCNGKLREIITVEPNQKYKFRVINGGEHFALRFSISGDFPLTVVAADSHPIEPYTVDSVVLHVGERFDVEVNLHGLAEGDSFWIVAETLDSQLKGYENRIRAIMKVSSDDPLTSEDVLDPSPIIKSSKTSDRDIKTVLNCYHAHNCIPVTALSSLPTRSAGSGSENGMEFVSGIEQERVTASEIHFVETHHLSAPQYSHFVRVDNSYWIQNDFPPAAMISREYRPANSVHPHSVPLAIASNSTIIIVWRTTLLMDHPVHIHGHSVEILDASSPNRQNCNLALAYCQLNEDYSTNTLDKIRTLDRSTQLDAVVKKDTFIIPAGGVIITRLRTGASGLWLAQGQMDVHSQDGMSFVLNVGDYKIPKLDDWLPNDFPTCNTTLVKTQQMNPACECFLYRDRPLLFEMPDKHLCSRSHLCHHEFVNTAKYPYEKGFSIQSTMMRDWKPSVIFISSLSLIVVATFMLLAFFPTIPSIQSKQNDGYQGSLSSLSHIYKTAAKRFSLLSVTADATTTSRTSIPHRRSTIDFSVGSIFDGMSSYIGTVNDADESENDEIDNEDACENDIDTLAPVTSEHRMCRSSIRRSNSRRRLSSVAASIEGRLDRALGSILIERSDEGNGTNEFGQGFEIIPDGYSIKGKLTFDPCDSEFVNSSSSFVKQAVYIFGQQFRIYFSSCCNALRLIEVGGVALITGQVFRQDLQEASEATVYELVSLILFLNIMWSFTRMYSIIPLQHQWFKSIQIVHKNRRFSLPPVIVARMLVLLLCECLWPAAFCFVCYPAMNFTADWIRICRIAMLICLNNICYVSLGAACALVSSMPCGMILATMMSQISILVSGVFTQLPMSMEWLNKQSPFFWTVRGLMKCVFVWSDNYSCLHGSSDIEGGVHQCFIEESLVIDQFKRRGIYDPSGSGVLEECLALLAIALCMHIFVCIRLVFSFYRVDWYKLKRMKSRITL